MMKWLKRLLGRAPREFDRRDAESERLNSEYDGSFGDKLGGFSAYTPKEKFK